MRGIMRQLQKNNSKLMAANKNKNEETKGDKKPREDEKLIKNYMKMKTVEN
jgi:hypothetical protein